MGSSALLLEWKPPQEINGILTGYRIYSQQVTEGSELGPIQERQPRIMKDTTGRAKLAGLKPHSKYRVTIKATTNAGEGKKNLLFTTSFHEKRNPKFNEFFN